MFMLIGGVDFDVRFTPLPLCLKDGGRKDRRSNLNGKSDRCAPPPSASPRQRSRQWYYSGRFTATVNSHGMHLPYNTTGNSISVSRIKGSGERTASSTNHLKAKASSFNLIFVALNPLRGEYGVLLTNWLERATIRTFKLALALTEVFMLGGIHSKWILGLGCDNPINVAMTHRRNIYGHRGTLQN